MQGLDVFTEQVEEEYSQGEDTEPLEPLTLKDHVFLVLKEHGPMGATDINNHIPGRERYKSSSVAATLSAYKYKLFINVEPGIWGVMGVHPQG